MAVVTGRSNRLSGRALQTGIVSPRRVSREALYSILNKLSFNIYQQPIVGEQPLGTLEPTSVQFSIGAMGGFLVCRLTARLPRWQAMYWMENLLGARLTIRAPDAPFSEGVVWEGFLNDIELGSGGPRRSLSDVWNYVTVSYSEANASNPDSLGERTITAAAFDSTSQGLYGIKELNSSQGGMTATNAQDLRDRMLAYYKDPRIIFPSLRQFVLPRVIDVSFVFLGYWATLAWRRHTSGITAATNVSTIITNVFTILGEFLNSDTTHIDTNTYQRSQYFDHPLTAQDTIKAMCALGDASSDLPYFFQILAGRKGWYFKQPSTKAYTMRVDGTIEQLNDGPLVQPYSVRPAKILEVADLSPAFVSSNLTGNARYLFIGETQFNNGLISIIPLTQAATVDVLLSQLGLRGGL